MKLGSQSTVVCGVSRRAYAKRRGCSEAAIRKRIEDGTLALAMVPSGRIDPDIADRLLAETVTATAGSSGSLSEARRRKAAAAVALLADEIAVLEASTATAVDVSTAERESIAYIARRLMRVADDAAPLCAGQAPVAAATALQAMAHAALTELSQTVVVADPGRRSLKACKALSLAGMSALSLATMRADLLAQRLEIRRALRRGELVDLATFSAAMIDRIMVVRSAMLALHYKLGMQFVGINVAAARSLIKAEIGAAVEELEHWT